MPTRSVTNDLRRVGSIADGFVGFVDPHRLAQRAAFALRDLVGLPLVALAIRDGGSSLLMSGVDGARTEQFRQVQIGTGEGIGGRAVQERRPISVENYLSDPRISNHFLDIVAAEGLGGMAAFPIEFDGEIIAVIYGGVRSIGTIGEQVIDVLAEAAVRFAPLIASSMEASRQIEKRVAAERQRLAGAMHDDVGHLLFSMGVSARHICEQANPELAIVAALLESHAQEAVSRMRAAFAVMSSSTVDEAFTMTIEREAADLELRSDITSQFVTRGVARRLSHTAESALIASARQALSNAEQHSKASKVVTTLAFGDTRVSLVVQDDGRGLPPNFRLESIGMDGCHWGLPLIQGRAERLGGRFSIRPGEDGGTTLRVEIPAVDD